MKPIDQSSYKSAPGWRRFWRAGIYAGQGLCAAFRHEAAFRQELLLVLLLTPCAFWLGESAAQVLLLLASLVLVLVVELLNSAIEALADALSLAHHPLLGRAKDLGSAAVLLTIALAVAIWLTMLWV